MINIVIIDDNPDSIDLITAYLPEEKFSIFATQNGNKAIEYIENNNVDLLITDIIMPGINGLEIISKVSSINPKLKILAISGGGAIDADQYFSLASGLGATKTLSKPFIADDLLAAIKELIPEA